jgi:general stress protein 26
VATSRRGEVRQRQQSEWTSLSGKAEIVYDQQQAERLWSAPLRVWFPDALDTNGLSLIKVHIDSAEYWESRSSKDAPADRRGAGSRNRRPDEFPATNRSVDL